MECLICKATIPQCAVICGCSQPTFEFMRPYYLPIDEMGFTSFFWSTLRIFKAHWITFTILQLAFLVLQVVPQVLLRLVTSNSLGNLYTHPLWGIWALWFIGSMGFMNLFFRMVVHQISDNQFMSIRETLKAALKRLPGYLWTIALHFGLGLGGLGVCIFLAANSSSLGETGTLAILWSTVLFGVFGILWILCHGGAPLVFVTENIQGMQALTRARQLIKGFQLDTFISTLGYFLCFTLFIALPISFILASLRSLNSAFPTLFTVLSSVLSLGFVIFSFVSTNIFHITLIKSIAAFEEPTDASSTPENLNPSSTAFTETQTKTFIEHHALS